MREYQIIAVNRNCSMDYDESNQMRSNKYQEDELNRYRHSRSIRNKRLRMIKRNIRLVSLTTIIVLIIALSFSRMNAKATSAQEATNPLYKYYTSVQIMNGDSLWAIASRYTDGSASEINTCMEEIRSINHLSKQETIKSGEYIIVPYYSYEYLE